MEGEITRINIDTDTRDSDIVERPSPEGEYVRWADHEARVRELEANYESLSNSIQSACTGSGCLNAHELRVALNKARERNTVLAAEVRASRETLEAGLGKGRA